MNWVEQEMSSRQKLSVNADREKVLNAEKAGALPVIVREADGGDKPINPVQFQPVQSPGIFEAEFAAKDGDLVFHFWPWHYHLDEKAGRPKKAFPKGFGVALSDAMHRVFDADALNIAEDRDMGSWFVRVLGGSKHQFWRKRSITAVTDLHKLMGGE